MVLEKAYKKLNTLKINGSISFQSDLSSFTWLKTGGKADIFFIPYDLDDLKFFLKNLNKSIPIFILGAGSNTLFRDLGFNGVVIKLSKKFDYINFLNENQFKAGAATNCIKMARVLAKNEASGLEFFSGIPGSVGGAIKMNAGAYGSDTSQYIKQIKIINRDGIVKNIAAKDYVMGYRKTTFPDEFIFLEATFNYIKNRNISENLNKIDRLVTMRKLTQPITERTSGSTFKNPKKKKAWKLIRESGCYDLQVGKASLSKIHTNFIINNGGATSSDIEELGEKIIERVLKKFSIKLIWEIKIIGNKGI